MFTKEDKIKKIIKYLNIDKPFIIFDLEATGPALSTDRIIQLAYVKVWPDGKTQKKVMLFNPEIEIAQEVVEICGITNKDVKNEPLFKNRAQEIWDIFNNCYYGGFNVINFDLPMLRREFIRVGMDFEYNISQIIDSRVIFQFMLPRNLSSAYEYYCGKEYKKDKNAITDVESTIEILSKQLSKYREVHDLKFIKRIHQGYSEESQIDNSRKIYWKDGQAYLSFSKHRDKTLKQVAQEDPEFLEWMLTADFTRETKVVVGEVLKTTK